MGCNCKAMAALELVTLQNVNAQCNTIVKR